MMPPTKKRNSSSMTFDPTTQLDELRSLIATLRAEGVARLRSGDLEVELMPYGPPRGIEDFATDGAEDDEPSGEDDGRFDHVSIRLKPMEDQE